MRPSLQKYYEDLVSKQPESVKRFLLKNRLMRYEKAFLWLSETDRDFIKNGYEKGLNLRADYVFTKLRRRFHDSFKKQVPANVIQEENITPSSPINLKLSFANQCLLMERFLTVQLSMTPKARIILQKKQLKGVEQLMPFLERKSDISEYVFSGSRQSKTQQEIIRMIDSLRDFALALQKTEIVPKENTCLDDVQDKTKIGNNQNNIHITKKEEQHVGRGYAAQQRDDEVTLQIFYQNLQHTLSVRAQNVLSINGLTSIKSIESWLSGGKKSFVHLHHCGSKTAKELDQMLSVLVDFNNKQGQLESDSAMDRILTAVRVLLEEFLSTASTRTVNLMKQYQLCTAEKLMPYVLNSELLAPMQKKHAKITKVNQEYTAFINKVRIVASESTIRDIGPYEKVPLSNITPLSSCDNDFAIQFKETRGYWPMFFLLHKYFQNTKDKREQIFADYSGFYGKALQYEKVSIKYNLTQERVRQIINHVISNPNPILSGFLLLKDWDNYPIHQLSFIGYDDNKKIVEIERTEGLLLSNHDIRLLLQLHGFDCYWLDTSRNTISSFYTYGVSEYNPLLISNKFRNYRFKKALREAKRLSCLKSVNDVTIPIHSYFVSNEAYWNKYEYLSDELQSSLVAVLCKLFELLIKTQIQNGQMVIKASTIDYMETFYKILKNAGTRLHTDDIFARLNNCCKEADVRCKYSDSSQIITFLTRDNRIIPYGKSGFWGLKEWGETVGSIREITIQIVKNAKQPIHINDLTKIVMENRPDSNEKSISSVIRQTAAAGELLLFYDDYIGDPKKRYKKDYVIMPQSFDEWAQAFKNFVLDNRRLPYSSQDGYEGYLYRWYYRSGRMTDLTSEEILKFDALEKELAHYPQNATEYNFLQNCNLYKKYIEKNKRMLTKDDDPELFNWFYKSSRNYSTYNDNRNKYFSQLLQSLSAILY